MAIDTPTRDRVTSGNQNTAEMRQAFRDANPQRETIRGTGRSGGGASINIDDTPRPGETRAQKTARSGVKQVKKAAKSVADTAKAAKNIGIVGTLARGGAKLVSGVGTAFLANEALSNTTEQLEQKSGLQPIRPLRGTQPEGQPPGAQAPVNLERPGDKFLSVLPPIVGAVRGAFGFGEDAPETTPAPTGLREFTNADIGGGELNRGTDSVEKNQAVAQRLSDKGAKERAAGLRAAEAAAGDGRSLDEKILERLSGGSNLASAFGALNAGGNVLRQRAAERGRDFSAQQSSLRRRETADLGLRNSLATESAKAGLNARADAPANAAKFEQERRSFSKLREDAIASGDSRQVERAENTIIDSAVDDPNGPAAGEAQSMLSKVLMEDRNGLFNSIFNKFFGNKVSDADITQALDKITVDEVSGELLLPNPDGSGTPVEMGTELEDLPPQYQRLVLSISNRRVGTQNVGRGDPNRGDPNRTSLRSGRRGT